MELTTETIEGSYLYTHDFVWHPGSASIPVTPYALTAYNVTKMDRIYQFNLTGLEGRYETYYGWSLVLLNEDNIIKLGEALSADRARINAQEKAKSLRALVTTLDKQVDDGLQESNL